MLSEILFYSSVILKGTETTTFICRLNILFYSSVILKGTETGGHKMLSEILFYSSVILKGTETEKVSADIYITTVIAML